MTGASLNAPSCFPFLNALEGRARRFTLAGLFHKAKSPTPFHSINSMDNLFSVENGYQPVYRSRGVSRAECNVFPEDAPGILDGRQYDVLIRGVHGTRLLSADSIRSPFNCSYMP
jgi:hypothetical protein